MIHIGHRDTLLNFRLSDITVMTGSQENRNRIFIKWLLKRGIFLKKEWNQLKERLLLQPCSRFLLHPWHGGKTPYEAILFYNFFGRVLLGMRLLAELFKKEEEREILMESFDDPRTIAKRMTYKKGAYRSVWPRSPFLVRQVPKIADGWWKKLSISYKIAKKEEGCLEKNDEWERIAALMRRHFLDDKGNVIAQKLINFRHDPKLYSRMFNDQFRYVDPAAGYLKNYLEAIDLILAYHRLAAVVDPLLLASLAESVAGNPLCIHYRGVRLSEKLLYHGFVCDDIQKQIPPPSGGKREVIVDIGAGYGGLDRLVKLYRQRSCIILVDFAETLILSGYYLRHSFPNARIALMEDLLERKEWERIYEEYDFVLMVPEWLGRLPDGSVDLVVNTASMGFMAAEWIGFYLGEIDRIVREGGYFYSLNKVGDDRWGIGLFGWEFRGGWLVRSLRYGNRFDYPQWVGQKISPRLDMEGET